MTFAGEFLGLPGLRGFWPMSAFLSSGDTLDMSSNDMTLTYNGSAPGPTYNVHASGGPYIDLDGTGDYLSRADEAGLDILGTETYIASAARGLTMGGWFWWDTLATAGLISKYDSGAELAYTIYSSGTGGNVVGQVSSSGADSGGASNAVTATSAVTTGGWFFVALKFTPSTELALFINGTETSNTTSIEASIFNSTSLLRIGAVVGATNFLNGRAGMCFLCAMALSDTAIENIRLGTKANYGL